MAETVASIKERILAMEGVREAVVISAAPLPHEIVAELRRKLEGGGGRVRLQQRIDPSLIGGLVLRIGDAVYDGSLRSRLGAVAISEIPGSSER